MTLLEYHGKDNIHKNTLYTNLIEPFRNHRMYTFGLYKETCNKCGFSGVKREQFQVWKDNENNN